MKNDPVHRTLLLVEDNPGDARLVSDLLTEPMTEAYRVIHAACLKDGLVRLRTDPVDVVVLDLSLPDGHGVETVQAVRSVAGNVPIVVLTGAEDDGLALACIDAGAQDYLSKNDVRAQSLRRAIGYAITRISENQLRHQRELLERYRSLSSLTQGTTVTAALLGSGSLALRNRETFANIVAEYYALLETYLAESDDRVSPPRHAMERVITQIGDANGGPRDLLDVHVAALEKNLGPTKTPRLRSLVIESRLLALEMMGLLVDYYRVGHRRYWEGSSS